MHRTRRRQPDQRSRRSELPANAPHFFKVVDSAAVEQGKLGLPKKFVRKHGNDLSNLVSLKVPNGAVWQVQLMKVDGKVWLHTGWTEFVKFYSIRFGHFLVFRYEGDSRFNVLIFDTTACEIEYPFKAIHAEAQEAEANNSLKVPKIEECDNGVLVENKKRKERESSLYSQPCEMRSTCSKSCSGLKHAKLNPDVDSHFPTKKISEKSKVPVKECNGAMAGTQKHTPLAVPEHVAAVDRANAFKSKNPFCMVIMFPSYVSGCRMNLPLGFAKRHFTQRQNSVILRISDDERTWPLKFIMRASYANLTLGWRTFVHDNHLSEGDVCIFELIKGIEHSFKVEIFRHAEDAPCQHRRFTSSQRTDCIEEVPEATEKRRKVIHIDSAGNGCRIDETGMSNFQNRFVKKELRLYQAEANNSLKVPKIEECDNGVLVENKKRKERKSSLYSQPCEMRITCSKSCSDLKRAKLNPDVDSHFPTKKISEKSKVPVKECNGAMAGTQKHTPLAVPEHVTAVDRANAFKSKNPFCMVIMYPSYVSGCRMNLPLGFAKRHFTQRQNSVILRISDDERTWSLKFNMRASDANLTLGWRTFVHDNHLSEGDVCIFELIKGIEHSFKVEIFRHAEDAPCQHRRFTSSQRTDCIEEVPEATEKRRKVIHIDSAGNGCRIDETGMSNSQNRFVKEDLRLYQDKFKESIHEETVGAKVECSTPMISREKFLEGLQGKTRALEEAELPFFKAVLTQSYLDRNNLGLPRRFVEQYIGKVSQSIMLRISNRSWLVRLSVYGKRKRGMLTTGWIEFVKDNTLQEGDVCVFELNKGIETVFEVTIFRCDGLLKSYLL